LGDAMKPNVQAPQFEVELCFGDIGSGRAESAEDLANGIDMGTVSR